MNGDRGMPNSLPYERMLQECFRGELKLVNSGLPRNRKRLSNLLHDEYPHVVCSDGSIHLFKRKELEYLANIIDNREEEALLLPILIEIRGSQAEAAIICGGEVEKKVVSRILDMPVACEQGMIRIYRSQLALLRRKLKTTTQYVFSPSIAGVYP